MIDIEPHVKLSGSAFQNNSINNTRPAGRLNDSNEVQVVSLTDWCNGNFINKRAGRELIKRKLIIAFRRHHVWWVRSNPECLPELLEYLGVRRVQLIYRLKKKIPSEKIKTLTQMEKCLVLKILSSLFSVMWMICGKKLLPRQKIRRRQRGTPRMYLHRVSAIAK